MRGSLRLLQVAGIDIRVHVTFVFLVAAFALEFGQRFGSPGLLFGVAAALSLFLCVTLHELGHSLVAKAFGVSVREIVLLPIGGQARLLTEPQKPAHEFAIALAGPFVNVVLAFVFAAVLRLEPTQASNERFWTELVSTPSARGLLAWLLLNNLYLAIFNLLPAFPLDGGRALRALLWWRLGHQRATRAAAAVGQILAAGLILFGLFAPQPNVMWIIIGALIFFWAGRERFASEAGTVLVDLSAGEVCNPSAQTLAPSDGLGEVLDLALRTGQAHFAVVHGTGLIGVVLRDDAIAAAGRVGLRTPVGAVMRRDLSVCTSETPLTDVREQIQATSRPVVVIDGQRFVGVLGAQDIARISEVSARLASVGVRRPKAAPSEISPSQSPL